MAVTDRNIVITPNRTAVGKVQPKIVFTGADSSIGDSSAITLFANPENSGTLSFSGTAGQLFSITNDLTGTIFSVNDISGMPSLSINDQGVIQLAEFNGRVIIGDSVGSDDSVSSLQISGGLSADSATLSGTITTANSAAFRSKDTSGTIHRLIHMGADNNTFINQNTRNNEVRISTNGTQRVRVRNDGLIVFGDVTFDSAGALLFDKSDKSLKFGDQYRAKFGDSGDLEIYHDGNNSYIKDAAGTGAIIHMSNVHSFRNAANTEQLATFVENGKVELYHNNVLRLDTLDSGVNITGNLRVNNAPFTSGGTDSASVIALIDSDYVQARSSGTRGTLNNVNSRSFTGDNSTTAFALQVTPADSDDVFVFVNGVLQHTNSYSVSGNTVTLDSAPDSSSTIDIRSHLIKSENVSLRDHKRYIYTLGSTVDSVSGADSAGATLTYDAGLVDVYVNGARLVTEKDYTAGNGTQIVFDSALGAGNIVEVVSHSRSTVFTPEITSADVSLTTTDSGQNIDSFAKASFRTYKFTAQISHAASSSFHSEEVLLVHNGTNVAMTTFGQVLLDSNLGSFDAFISGSNVQVKFSPTKTNTTVKLRGVRTPV